MRRKTTVEDTIIKYELLNIKFTWAYFLAGVLYIIAVEILKKFNFPDLRQKISPGMAFCIGAYSFSALLLWIKYYFGIRKGLLRNGHVYMVSRIIGVLILSFFVVYIDVGHWAYVCFLFPVMITSLTKGRKTGLFLVLCIFLVHMSLLIALRYLHPDDSAPIQVYTLFENLLFLTFLYIAFTLFALICGEIFKDNTERDNENKRLVEQLEEKYELLAVTQEEIKLHYRKLKETNSKLEEANKKLNSSVAEFYTLQQISQAIGSILDTKELLKYVNDIILGVMGVNYSSIILYDDRKNKLKVHTTSIVDPGDLAVLRDNINCPILLDVLKNNKPVMENFVDPDEYYFAREREINSLVCVPLSTKTKKYGLALIEHRYYNAFDEENVRLLDIIGQQVGIALENAELYQRMQELANRDGLTGIYNRLYFQQRMEKEFNFALLEGYPLSLAIFDIDYFKRFNDTFGHLFGDKVLKRLAETVESSLRKNDILARFGGEEFIILFPHTGLDEAYEKVEALRQIISHTIIKDELVTASVTVSFGVSSYPQCASNENELLRTADDALYEAKASGRNCVKTAMVLNKS